MLILRGGPALSSFRCDKLLAGLRAVAPGVRAVAADFVHLADVSRPLEPGERDVLEALLTYGPEPVADPRAGLKLIAVPRPGTISPSLA